MNQENYQKIDKNYLIETIGITKVFESNGHMITAVSDVSLKIAIGEFVMLFGSSTSGKSTLISILCGLEKPDIGEVLIKGEPLYEFSEGERSYLRSKRFGFLLQAKRWVENMSLLDNVALPLILSGEIPWKAHNIAKEKLSEYGLTRHLHRRPESFSVYNQKIAAVVRSIINNPWVVFADEPYRGLNYEDSLKIISLLKKISEEQGIAVIMTTNSAEYLKEATNWHYLHDGHIEDITSEKNPLRALKKLIISTEDNEAGEGKVK